MWVENGHRGGFWIVRNTWGNWYARVLSVGGRGEGKLVGRAPYYGNPEVLVDVWDRRTGWVHRAFVLSSPGTYSYGMLKGAPEGFSE